MAVAVIDLLEVIEVGQHERDRSGLALYWARSNVLGIVQQYVMSQTSLGRKIRAIAAKRAAKKLSGGTGKIINAAAESFDPAQGLSLWP